MKDRMQIYKNKLKKYRLETMESFQKTKTCQILKFLTKILEVFTAVDFGE